METNDPYRPSAVPLVAPAPKLDLEPASKWRRFANWLIDRMVMFGIAAGLGGLGYVLGGEAFAAWLDGLSRLADIAFGYAVWLVYYTVMEGLFGLTLGKLITNTRVVDEYGRPPGLGLVLRRSLGRLIPFDALSLLLSDDAIRRAWHDRLSRSYVINRPRRGQPAGKPKRSVHEAFANGVLPPTPPPLPVDAGR